MVDQVHDFTIYQIPERLYSPQTDWSRSSTTALQVTSCRNLIDLSHDAGP